MTVRVSVLLFRARPRSSTCRSPRPPGPRSRSRRPSRPRRQHRSGVRPALWCRRAHRVPARRAACDRARDGRRRSDPYNRVSKQTLRHLLFCDGAGGEFATAGDAGGRVVEAALNQAYAACVTDARRHYRKFSGRVAAVAAGRPPACRRRLCLCAGGRRACRRRRPHASERHRLLDSWSERLRHAASSGRSGPPPQPGEPAHTLQKELLGGFEYLDTVTAVDAHTVQLHLQHALLARALRHRPADHRPEAHLGQASRTRPIRPTRTRSAPGPTPRSTNFQTQSFELRKNPELLATGRSSRSRASRCSRSPATTAPTSPTTNGEIGLGGPVHPGHREHLRREGPGATALLVPGHRRDDQLAVEHHQGALRRRGRAQGASMAIDREPVTAVAMQGYTHPPTAPG